MEHPSEYGRPSTLTESSPRPWGALHGVAERRSARRFRRLAKDCERLPDVLRGLHFQVFAILMRPKAIPLLTTTENA
jgi:hypothetical protein